MTKLPARLALAAGLCLAAASLAQAKIVAAPEMAKYCTGEAAAALGTKPRNVMTLPVEKSKGSYIVYGQSPAEGADVTTFECHFGGDGKFKGLKITSQPAAAAADTGGAPPAALAACKEMVGVAATVQTVSPLKPGYTEIILKEKASGRRVACTATDAGGIEDWVELN